MKKIVAVFCVLSLLMLAACDSRENQIGKQIAGRWEGTAGATEFQSMEFVPSNDNPLRGQINLRIYSNEISGEYEITPGEEQHLLSISYTLMMFPAARTFHFTIADDALTLQEEDSSASATYRRAAAEQ